MCVRGRASPRPPSRSARLDGHARRRRAARRERLAGPVDHDDPRRAPAACAASTGHSTSGRPHSGCSTLGVADRIRVPSPAARTTTVSPAIAASLRIASAGVTWGVVQWQDTGFWYREILVRIQAPQSRANPRRFRAHAPLGWRGSCGRAVACVLAGRRSRSAADPIMPLAEVQAGMRCTGLLRLQGPGGRVVRRRDPRRRRAGRQRGVRAAHPRPGVGRANRGHGRRARLLAARRSCARRADGTLANAGAISETIGEYGGMTVLATPIEQILGTPVRRATADAARGLSRARPLDPAQRQADLDADHGRRPVSRGVMRGAAGRRGQARRDACWPRRPFPADSSPILPFVPGSAVGVGLSSGDLSIVGHRHRLLRGRRQACGPTGTSSTASAARGLLLQDAYVAAIVNNPVQVDGTQHLQARGARCTTAGRSPRRLQRGRRHARARCRRARRSASYASDEDRDASPVLEVDVADETDVDNPTGVSALGFVGPLADPQRRLRRDGRRPAAGAGPMCMQVVVARVASPLRFCNRYVNDGAPAARRRLQPARAGGRARRGPSRSALFDVYKGKPVHVARSTRASARPARSAWPTCAAS